VRTGSCDALQRSTDTTVVPPNTTKRMRRSHCSRHELLVRLSLLLALATYAALTLPAAAQTQTFVPPLITTDATDYNAGDEVFIVGDHWTPGLVTLQIAENGNPGHVDTLYAIADATGLVTAQYLVPGHGTAQTFTLIATDATGAASATTVFSNAYWPEPFAWDPSNWTTPAPTTNPWLRTDQNDYQPGSIALVAGGGWTPGDMVTLGLTETGGDHSHPTVYLHATTDQTGAISAGYVVQPHDLGETYEVVATSATDSTISARTTFADSGASFHNCALTTGGGAKCWGSNGSGQVGDGSVTTQKLLPVNVSGIPSGGVLISAGGDHTCSLMIGGGIKCWGRNSDGQLGDGTSTQHPTPVEVSGLTSNVSFLSAGGVHTCAVTTAGGVKCWGNNGNGRLGDNTTTPHATPVNVTGLASGVAEVRAGGFHTCALTTSGGVKCWGWNVFGQLGNATTVDSWVPVDVSDLSSGVAQVSAGADHTCALTTAGGVKCWGLNGNGQLGDGTVVSPRTTPVEVSGLTSGVAQIVAGAFHTCALTTGGGVKCWGNNGNGRLGDNSTTQRTAPVNVFGLTSGVAQIYAGVDFTCALTTSGGVKCWGTNGFGQLGTGLGNSSKPVDVSSLTAGVITIPDVKAPTFTLTYTAGANGTISGFASQNVFPGQSGTAVTAAAHAGFHFTAWSDGLLSATRTDTNVIASLTVTASFAPDAHTLTYAAEAHGAISGTSPQTVNDGADGTPVTAVPDTGYHFVAWSDGVLTAARTDLHVTADLVLTASFAINEYTLTYTAGANGTIGGELSQTVIHGASGSAVTAVPNAGYLFVKWSDGSSANPRTDTNVVANLAVSASFAEVPYVVAGFFGAVDMPHANVVVWNSAQAGQTVPVKWRLTKNGVPVSDPGSFLNDPGGLFSYPVNCYSGVGNVDLAIEEYAPGNSSLAYNGDGYWQFNWQTLKAYKSSCRVMFVRFRDGTVSAAASFKFK
jgi:alpha-tubulin suppressor-like RCC1 family protein